MKNLIYILTALFLTGCLTEVVSNEYRGTIVIGEVVQTGPTELLAEPLDMERATPTDPDGLIRVTPSATYDGLDPAALDTVQVVMRYREGLVFWLDSATPTQ